MFKLETIETQKADGTTRKVLCKILEKKIDDKNTKRYAVPVTEEELMELEQQIEQRFQEDISAVRGARGTVKKHRVTTFDEPPPVPEFVVKEAKKGALEGRLRTKKYGVSGKVKGRPSAED